VARPFKPRRISLFKQRFTTRAWERPSEKETTPSVDELAASEPARAPSTVEGLHFWFHAPAVCQRNAPITTELTESGPHHMIAMPVENGPYGFLSLNRRGTLFYPHTKVEERRQGAPGTLLFGAGQDWNFFFDGSAFTVFALFRPNVPCYPPYNQEQSTLLRVGSEKEAAPAFFLQWDGRSCNAKASVISVPGHARLTIGAPSQSHLRQRWGPRSGLPYRRHGWKILHLGKRRSRRLNPYRFLHDRTANQPCSRAWRVRR
jgi:hypothetical protein